MPPETITPTFNVEFENTADDIVRAYLFTASGSRRNSKFCLNSSFSVGNN